ncbi:MFS transporter [Vineibacter terrae]|uniref:MFS transporter n=1 Tax=Vineibacter terrae TaxID=2586908 RepID=UPI002E33CB49|nr:MFS transporter [Vineibacter terrae]HEX2885624.1 MFS transporter [Vineibacter terrae]
MLATSLARALAARGIHYGWVMTALALGYGICASATLGIPGVLLVPMAAEFGWSIGDLSGPLALRMTLFGLVAPFAGALMLRYGPRAVLVASAVLLIAGLLHAMTMSTLWELWLALGTVLGIASGMTSLVLATTIATRWFVARRGLVLGILSAATATGQLVFLPTAAWLAEHYGWRAALLPSIGTIGLLVLAFMLFACDRPADVGLTPLGGAAEPPAPAALTGNAVAMSVAALADAARSRVFWVLAFTFFVCGVSSFGLTPHFVTLCGDFGITPVTSTGLLALIGICDLIGTIGSGWLSDRYDNRWLLAWYYGLRGLSLLWLPYSGFSLVGLSAFAVFYGLDFIATVPPTVRLTAQRFGAERAPLVFGWIYASHQVGAGIMALAAGATRDALASYLPAFLAAGALCLVATLSLLLLQGRVGSAVPARQAL